MTAHQTRGDLQAFFIGSLAQFEHLLHAGRIHGERLLHEHIDALLDGVFKVRGTERRVGGQHGHVAGAKTIDRLPIGVKSNELPLLRNVYLIAQGFAQGAVCLRQPVFKQVGHGVQLDRTGGLRVFLARSAVIVAHHQSAGRHGIGRSTASTSAATDQGQPDRVVFSGVNARNGDSRQGRDGSQPGGVLQKIATRCNTLLSFAHKQNPLQGVKNRREIASITYSAYPLFCFNAWQISASFGIKTT